MFIDDRELAATAAAEMQWVSRIESAEENRFRLYSCHESLIIKLKVRRQFSYA